MSIMPPKDKKAASVFILAHFEGRPYGGALYEVNINKSGQVTGETHQLLDPVVSLFDPKQYMVNHYVFVEAVRFCTSQLLLYPIPGLNYLGDKPHSLYVFDTNTKSLDLFKAPISSKIASVLIPAYGKLYNFAEPQCFRLEDLPNPFCECYDPNNKAWKPLDPYPYLRGMNYADIRGFAVCYGCILLSLYSLGSSEFILFHVATETWHPVQVPTEEDDPDYDDGCFSFRGRAVVVQDKIYALSPGGIGEVVTFSLKMETKPSGRIVYSLEKLFVFPLLESYIEGDEDCRKETEYLVHLGNLRFCLVQTVFGMKHKGRQYLQIFTFEVVQDGGMQRMEILCSTVRDVDIHSYGRFSISFSFSPEFDDIVPEEEAKSQAAMIEWAAKKKSKMNRKREIWEETESEEEKSCERTKLGPKDFKPTEEETKLTLAREKRAAKRRRQRIRKMEQLGVGSSLKFQYSSQIWLSSCSLMITVAVSGLFISWMSA